MTTFDHIRLVWGRPMIASGDDITFLDGLPPPSAAELAATHNEALAALGAERNPPTVKVWPDAEYFMAEFSLLELAGVSLSTDPTIAALRLMLSTWLSTVRADDSRVLTGLDALVAAEIISPDRRAEILA